jgi:HEAT repeat protein
VSAQQRLPLLGSRFVDELVAGGERRSRALQAIVELDEGQSDELLDDDVIAALVATLADARRSEQRRAADVLSRLLERLPPLTAALVAALESDDQRLRWGAAYTLGHSARRSSAIWPAVREAMALEDGDQRWAAAELACTLARADRGIVDELCAAVSADPATIRKMALYCLRDLRADNLGAIALGALDDTYPAVRLAALSASVTAAAGSAVVAERCAERIAQAGTCDPDPGVRRAAISALGKLGADLPAVRTAIVAAENDPDPVLARAASRARRDIEEAARRTT